MLSLSDLRRPLPPQWKLDVAVDTGTFMSATFTLFPPDDEFAFIVAEFPNYRYVGGDIELLDESIPEWCRRVTSEYARFRPGVTRVRAWADANSQFKSELSRYKISLLANHRRLELRVEIAREYIRNRHALLAPWLTVLPYELELAQFPDDTSSAGRFERLKTKDHTLDCVEHTLSRRPRHLSQVHRAKESFIDRFIRENRSPDLMTKTDTHLGGL